jgi:DNA invertase Pin-like site-specific DNA recombinase
MSLQRIVTSTQEVESDIRKYVIEVRGYLAERGYREVVVFKEARHGLVYCALWELVDVPANAKAGMGYGRVSDDVQSRGHSLATQIRHELDLADERGHTLRYIYVDAGITGRDDRRPAFVRMMRRAVRGDVESLYCYDLYRYYRNLHGLTTYVKLLEQHKVQLISTSDRNVDFGTRDGKLLMYIKGIIGERYLDDLSRTTQDNKLARAMKGYSNASWPPYGYCRGNCLDCTDPNGAGYCPRFGGPELWRELGDDPQVFSPHPLESVAMHQAAEWYATGRYSDTDIAIMLNAYEHELEDGTKVPCRPKGQPGRTPANPRFRKDSTRDMLQNPYYSGFVTYRSMLKEDGQRFQGGKRLNPYGESREIVNGKTPTPSNVILFPGKHIPIIEPELFDLCQQVRGSRGFRPHSATKGKDRVYPLTGILRCTGCTEVFRGSTAGGIRYYEDVGRAQGATDCKVRSVRAEVLEEQVFAHVGQISIPEEWYSGILAYLLDSNEGRVRRREQRSVDSQLRVLTEKHRRCELSDSDYEQGKRRLERQLRHLKGKESQAQAGYTALLDDFPRLWAAATPLERKTLLHSIFLAIHVRDGEIVGYRPRDPFLPLFVDAS